jgi:pantothenate kinase
MDGFHLDNRLLDADGTRSEKGSPHTFDARGVVRLVQAMQTPDDLIYPIFDRSRDLAVAGAGRLPAASETVLIEGNYLLYNAPIWRALAKFWTVSIALTPPRALLHSRLVQRWLDHGMPNDQAIKRAEQNDMKNADLVLTNMLPADLILNEVPT